MGYACPVCEAPQRDAEHLANHLAFTALLRGGDHETWLDERVSDWADRDPAGLAPAVAERAPEREFPDLAGDAGPAGGDHEHEHEHEHEHQFEDALARQSGYGRDRSLDDETARVLEEARDLTERMHGDAEADNGKE